MQSRDSRWLFGGACLVALGAGCAHNHGNNYAYAPPYAPPVYPQPGAVAQPVSYAAPVAPGPGAVAPPAVPAGAVVAGQTAPCPQDCPDGVAAGVPVVVEGGA